jgi:hypothetical protein
MYISLTQKLFSLELDWPIPMRQKLQPVSLTL